MAKRSPFDDDPRFTRHRTLRAMRTGLVITAVGLVGLVLATVFMPALVDTAAEQAADASSSRRAAQATVAPLAIWILTVVLLVAGLLSVLRSYEWRHAESGNRLRRALYATFDGGMARLQDLHARFMGGEPSAYAPLPDTALAKYADTYLEVWDVPEDTVAYIALSTGKGRGRQYAGLVRYEGLHYRALKAAMADSHLRKPLPDAANPLLAGDAR